MLAGRPNATVAFKVRITDDKARLNDQLKALRELIEQATPARKEAS